MKAVVFRDVSDIRLEDVPEPTIEAPSDAIVRVTLSAICGTDLHFVRGSVTGMKSGTILGHEGVGVIEEVGEDVRNLDVGDRVVIPSTIACGHCSYCRSGYYALCDNMNPHGKQGGTAFYGGPEATGAFNGLQAEKARIPLAAVNLIKLPQEVTDDQAILLSDIFPTGYYGADIAGIKQGHTVTVLGCGPVGQFAIASAKLMGAGRVFAIDNIEDRLATARAQGAETINFDHEDPVQKVRDLTGGIGTDCAIDAVGVDAECPKHSPTEEFRTEQEQVALEIGKNERWKPGSAPSQSLQWGVEIVAKAGTLAIIGVYPPNDTVFPIGLAMNRNLTLRMGNCNHRKYIPKLVELVRSKTIDPTDFVSKHKPMDSIIDAYHQFDAQQPGWLKVAIAV